MKYCVIWLCYFGGVLFAQQDVETPAGSTMGDYTVTQSFETGYRSLSVTGNESTYRSQVNFGNGLRLFDGDVEASSKDGKGLLFDQLSLKTEGLGNDPYESARFRIEKNGWYEYDLTWRLNDYFNPGLTTANGVDAENLQHRLQDHDLTLLPHSRVKFLLGYSRSTEDGPALTSFDEMGFGTVPLFQNVRRTQDEYRAGVEAKLWGFKVSILHDWEFFRDDTVVSPGSPASFLRLQPDHGETSGWRGFLARDFGSTVAVNGRVTYQGTGHGSSVDEEAFNALPSSVPSQQIVVAGEASRPTTAANLNITWSPSDQVSLTNQASFDQLQMNGNDVYEQFDTGTLDSTALSFQFLGIRTIVDALDLSYQPRNWLGFSGGYEFSTRLFRSIAQASDNSEPAAGAYEQSNTLHAGTAGVRLRPVKRLSINLSGELGHTDRPIYPVSEKDYHAFRGRVQYKAGTLLVAATAQADYNVNSASISSFSSQSRNYGAEAGWTPRPWLTFDVTWTKLHLNTAGGLAYFVNSSLTTGTDSLYISNLHFVNASVRLAAGKRADIYLGYSRVQDTGDGRSAATGDGVNLVPAFNVAQTYPLLYDTPMARVSVPVVARLRFNAGWQYYRYNEQFFAIRDYHANTAYTSLAWSF
jgi:hypothetical protein